MIVLVLKLIKATERLTLSDYAHYGAPLVSRLDGRRLFLDLRRAQGSKHQNGSGSALVFAVPLRVS
jgi:hypothetical protein